MQITYKKTKEFFSHLTPYDFKRVGRIILVIAVILMSSGVPTRLWMKSKGVVGREKNDSQILEAKQKAQSSIDTFISKQTTNNDPSLHFNIKSSFDAGENSEHMWIEVVNYDDEKQLFEGILINDPYWIEEIKYGDTVYIEKEKVEDWMIFNNEKILEGYYTDFIK